MDAPRLTLMIGFGPDHLGDALPHIPCRWRGQAQLGRIGGGCKCGLAFHHVNPRNKACEALLKPVYHGFHGCQGKFEGRFDPTPKSALPWLLTPQ